MSNFIYVAFSLFLTFYSLFATDCEKRIRLGEPIRLVIPKNPAFHVVQVRSEYDSGMVILSQTENQNEIVVNFISFQIDSIQCIELIFQDSFLRPVHSKKVCYCFQSVLTSKDSLRYIPILRQASHADPRPLVLPYLVLLILGFFLIVIVSYHKRIRFLYERWRLKRKYQHFIRFVSSLSISLPSSIYVEQLNRVWKKMLKELFGIPIGAWSVEELQWKLKQQSQFSSEIYQIILHLFQEEIHTCFYAKSLTEKQKKHLQSQVMDLIKQLHDHQLHQLRAQYGI